MAALLNAERLTGTLKGIMAINATRAGTAAPSSEFASHARPEARVALWPIVLVIYTTLLPQEVRLEAGPLSLFAARIALIAVLPFIIRKIMAGAIRFALPDALVLVAGLWMIVAMVAHYGLAEGLQRGGSIALDSTLGYFLARISLRSLQDLRRVLILISPGLLMAGLAVMIESIAQRPIIQPVVQQLFGRLPYYLSGEVAGFQDREAGARLGLMRGKGPFAHPIHAGLYLAVCVPLYLMAGIRGWPRQLGHAAGLLSFFSLSSAALLALILSYLLVGYDRLQRLVRELNWTLLVGVGSGFLLLVQFISNSGVPMLIGRYLTFNPATAYYRHLTWRYGMESVQANPWIGIGVAGYERPNWMVSESIDAHWLLLAIRFGMIPAAALLLATVLALVMASRASVNSPPGDQRLRRGVAISLFVLTLSMFTVSLLGGVLSWFTILLGACVACAQPERPAG